LDPAKHLVTGFPRFLAPLYDGLLGVRSDAHGNRVADPQQELATS
jgi:hypothetical protein